jgi:hypothetical protein
MQLHASALQVGAGTAVQLVAAPGTGKRITILGYVVSIGGTATNVSPIDSVNASNTKQWSFSAKEAPEDVVSSQSKPPERRTVSLPVVNREGLQ